MHFGLTYENLPNTYWDEAQFAMESRLSYEKESVEEINFAPGIPY